MAFLAADWNQPTNTSTYANVLTNLKDRDLSSAKMDFASDTNLPDGVIRFNRVTAKFEIYTAAGQTWADVQPTVAAHIASTSNPHSVTAAQVGSPTTAAFTSHTGNTSNPHSVTAAQAGALKITNYCQYQGCISYKRQNSVSLSFRCHYWEQNCARAHLLRVRITE